MLKHIPKPENQTGGTFSVPFATARMNADHEHRARIEYGRELSVAEAEERQNQQPEPTKEHNMERDTILEYKGEKNAPFGISIAGLGTALFCEDGTVFGPWRDSVPAGFARERVKRWPRSWKIVGKTDHIYSNEEDTILDFANRKFDHSGELSYDGKTVIFDEENTGYGAYRRKVPFHLALVLSTLSPNTWRIYKYPKSFGRTAENAADVPEPDDPPERADEDEFSAPVPEHYVPGGSGFGEVAASPYPGHVPQKASAEMDPSFEAEFDDEEPDDEGEFEEVAEDAAPEPAKPAPKKRGRPPKKRGGGRNK